MPSSETKKPLSKKEIDRLKEALAQINQESMNHSSKVDETKVSSRFRIKRRKSSEAPIETIPEVIDISNAHCPESISSDELKNVIKTPEEYLEINIIKKNRVVDCFYLKAELKKFKYKKATYNIKEDAIYLMPTKSGMFMPTTYYREDAPNPKGFKQLNKGITGKAMSLLYMEQLYITLLYSEEMKWNFFIVLLSIITLIALGVACYFIFFYNGGIMHEMPIPSPQTIISPMMRYIHG